jgi:hypothetical protein
LDAQRNRKERNSEERSKREREIREKFGKKPILFE